MRSDQSFRFAALDDLQVFAAVAEAQGFSAAARRLGLSKTVVSAAVARLETRLGLRLLQRTTRRLSLTEAGRAALPHAQRAVLAARDAEEAALSLRASPRGVLRVNAPMSFGLLHVVPALSEFAQAYPEIHVDLVLDDRRLDLVEGGFDLAVRIGDLPDSSLVAVPVGHNRNLLVAHADYLAHAGSPREPADLARHAALVYSLSASGSEWTLLRDGRREQIPVSGPLQANSSLALRQAALQGLGIARMPWFAVGADLAAGRLQRVLPDWEMPGQGIHVLTSARAQQPPKTRAFTDFLRQRFGDPPYWESGLATPGSSQPPG